MLPFTGRMVHNCIIPNVLPWAVKNFGLSAHCYPQTLPNGNTLGESEIAPPCGGAFDTIPTR